MERVCIFVDGENFRRNIIKLFSNSFQREEYLPRKAEWASFFDHLVHEKCGTSAQRVRAYWYVIEHVDFWPYQLPNDNTEKLRTVLCQDAGFKVEIESCQESDRNQKITEQAEEINKRRQRFRNRFDGWRIIQDGISKRHDSVEFRRAGAITYNLFQKKLGSEKAVDVKLAVDLITLKDIYDTAIIVSGDQDFVPVAQAVKNAGKKVISVAFEKHNKDLLPGGARRLQQCVDQSYAVPYHKLQDYLFPGASHIVPQ